MYQEKVDSNRNKFSLTEYFLNDIEVSKLEDFDDIVNLDEVLRNKISLKKTQIEF